MEDIKKGKRILEYKLSGMEDSRWILLANGSSVGHKRIEAVKKGVFSEIKPELIKSDGNPIIKSLACY